MGRSERREPIGVIGVGPVGVRMARRLMLHGHEVVVYDRSQAALDAAAAHGASCLASSAEVARSASVIITCVTDAGDVEEVLEGPHGVLEAARDDHLVIETTTSLPGTTRRLAALLAARGAAMVDAPVSRGVPAAEAGTLSIMAGGAAADIDRAEPVLRLLGTDIVRTGALGSGHAAKALNMMAMGINLIAAAQIMGTEHEGDAPGDRLAALNAGPGESFMTANHFPKYVLTGSYASTFTLGLMRKDLSIALRTAGEAGMAAPLGAHVLSLYEAAAAAGMADADNMRIVPRLEKTAAGIPLAAEDASLALAGITLAGLLEALAVARATGLAPELLLRVLSVSSGRSRLGDDVAAPVLEGRTPALRLDIGALVRALDGLSVSSELARIAAAALEAGAARGAGTAADLVTMGMEPIGASPRA